MPLLEAAGHRVEAPDLPGHGADPTPLSELSMEAYGGFVAESASGAGESIVLVGHSMAGAVISWAAECVPQMIRRLFTSLHTFQDKANRSRRWPVGISKRKPVRSASRLTVPRVSEFQNRPRDTLSTK